MVLFKIIFSSYLLFFFVNDFKHIQELSSSFSLSISFGRFLLLMNSWFVNIKGDSSSESYIDSFSIEVDYVEILALPSQFYNIAVVKVPLAMVNPLPLQSKPKGDEPWRAYVNKDQVLLRENEKISFSHLKSIMSRTYLTIKIYVFKII